MKPDLGAAAARGMIDGVLGLIGQPLVLVVLAVVITISIVARQQRR